MKNIILSFFLSLLLVPTLVSARGISQYPFVKDILGEGNGETVSITFDKEVLSKVNKEVRNFHIFDQNNNGVLYDIFFEKPTRIRDLKVFEVSSAREETPDASILIDNDPLTSFGFDPQDGSKDDPASVILDLGAPQFLSRIEIFDASGPFINEVLIRGGQTPESMKTIVSKRSYEYQYDLQSAFPVQYLQVYLWGNSLVVDDIRVYSFLNISAYFEAQPNMQYQLAYGGKDNQRITYNSFVQGSNIPSASAFRLSKEKWNSRYPEDADQDGIANERDNCFEHSNPRQTDTDEDGVGDVCDNAVQAKNISQSDVDFDGVGDITDNCVFDANTQQEDLDNDNIGDVCDGSFTEQETKVSPISYTIILVVILALFLLIQFYSTRKMNSKK